MKKLLLILIILLSFEPLYSQKPNNLPQPTFKAGEVLKYRLRYGIIAAAEATLSVVDSDMKFENHPVYHLIAEGRTAASFNMFYKVKNRYDSYVDRKTLAPYLYTENIREANYRRTDRVRFYQDKNKIVGRKGTFTSKGMTFDLVSAYYFARNIDMSRLHPGSVFSIPYFLNDEIANMQITYVGKERVKTTMGTINCLKFNPSIEPGRIFRKDSKLYLWITDDGNRIPVKAQVEILIGSITLELVSARGLKY